MTELKEGADAPWGNTARVSVVPSPNVVVMPAPRILFFGYSEVGYECLALLLERGDNVVALITHEDNPHEKIWFKTPAVAARERGIPVHTPENVNTPEWRERIAALQPDLIVSVYYRHMIGTKILALPRLGAWNMHGSLLPKYRGRAPINWAVLHGESRIGMTLHRMVKSADAGAIVDQEGVDLGPRDTAEQAFRKVLPCAQRVLARQIDALLAGTARETPQDDAQATYFTGRKPEDGRINWAQGSRQIFNLIRAVTDPYPGAFTDVDGTRLMVWWAETDSPASKGKRGAPGEVLSVAPLVVATGDGAVELTKIEWRGAAPEVRVGQVL
jgi:methionyl-tRNA formyltransferase